MKEKVNWGSMADWLIAFAILALAFVLRFETVIGNGAFIVVDKINGTARMCAYRPDITGNDGPLKIECGKLTYRVLAPY